VEIYSDEIKIQMEQAVVDISRQNITSNSLVHCTNNGITFTSTGFLLQRHGKISMKNVKVRTNKKTKKN
jgi:hypothetical protein